MMNTNHNGAFSESTQAWLEEKVKLDAMDDGRGPYLEWGFDLGEHKEKKQEMWVEFKNWATENLGSGFSLACENGCILDPVTFWSFKGFMAGRELRSANNI